MDPDGNVIETLWDIASFVTGIKSLKSNIKAGNTKAAISDGFGVVLDAAAIVIPGVPGGVGAGLKAVRAADKSIDAVKGAKTVNSVSSKAKKGVALSREAVERGVKKEAITLSEEGLTKNTKKVSSLTTKGDAINVIPDAIDSKTVYEVKDVKTLSFDKQIQGEFYYAKQNGKEFTVITGTNTHVSRTFKKNNVRIIRKDYLGPQKQ